MGWIYKITSPSGKSYIGQTIKSDPWKRWKQHQAAKKSGCRYLKHAIAYYSAENMSFEPLYEISYETHGYRWREFLNFWEKYEVEEEDTLSPRGYNLQTGGHNYIMNEETKQLLREKATGRKATEETKMKMKKTPEQRAHLSMVRKGIKLSQEHRDKISAGKKGIPKSEEHKAKIKAGQPVYTEERRQATISFNKQTKSKPVGQYTKEGVLVKLYESQRAASNETGVHYSGISKCILGHPKHRAAGGFVWRLQ